MAKVLRIKWIVSFRWFAISALLTLGFCARTQAQTKPLVLISQPDSTRAIAFESVTFTREPFPLDSWITWGQDRRTRVIIFALNLHLQPGEGLSNVAADAEDANHRHYNLTVESVGSVQSQLWLTALNLRLSDDIGDVGDVLIRVVHNSRSSNRVRIAIGHAGGGLPNDPGSEPTPAPPYPISGHVTAYGVGLANMTVTFTGPASGTTTTDSQGNYSILAPEPGNYVVSVADPVYVFSQPSRTLVNLSNRRDGIDFQGTLQVTGHVVDGLGRGIAGVKVNWTGSQSGTTSTRMDGTYSFPLTAFGNYTLTPSKEQDYYSYTPATASVTSSGNRVADFTATLDTSAAPSYVLEFDGAPKTIDYSMPLPGDYNLFWPDGLEFGHFFWEFWAMPGENAAGTWIVSDGYGGAHAILFGFSTFGAREPGRYQLTGNIWNGSDLTYFASDEGPAPNEWCHVAAGWDGQNIIVYFNGVPVGRTYWTGPRITPGGSQGCGRLLIGGSDHDNFIGRLAQVRGYENNNPREVGGNSVYETFRPETVFSVDGNLLSYFFRPSEDIADLSLFGQYGRQHAGLVRSTANGVLYPCPGCPLPQFVVDPTAPDFAHPNNPGQPPAPIANPAAVPVGALVFDSFSRRNSTYALGGRGGLSATEGGTLGPQTWLDNAVPGSPQPFGILNGRAVILSNVAAVTWISIPSPQLGLDIRVYRRAGQWGAGQNTGISFRVADAEHYFFAYSSDGADTSAPKKLTVGYYSDGLRTALATGVFMPADWTTLRVITTTAGVVRVYADSTLLYTTKNSFLSTSAGAGLYNSGPGLGLANRWDDFAVFAVP